MDMISPADLVSLPFADWVNSFVKDWLVPNFRPFFRTIQWPVVQTLGGFQTLLSATPMLVFTLVLSLIAWRTANRAVAVFTLLALCFIDMIGLWTETMTTLAMVVTAVLFCVVIGIPLGIASARSDIMRSILRPVLDVMQTIPSFVYLVPIVMLFGVGVVPGIIATIIFALPPIVRLTDLGIRNVREDLNEAATSFGATSWQALIEVQLPLALKTIMAGLNQTLMLALSMVVITALIGAGGLGLTVFTGLGRLDVGNATAGGVGIVLLAIILDRISQGLGERSGTQRVSLLSTLRSFVSGGAAPRAQPAR